MDHGVSYELGSMWKESFVEKLSYKKKHWRTRETTEVAWPKIGVFDLLHKNLTYLLHGAESFLKSQLVLQLVKKFPAFMEPESSLPYSQVPVTPT
jgi:hypothetical protein